MAVGFVILRKHALIFVRLQPRLEKQGDDEDDKSFPSSVIAERREPEVFT